MTEGMRVFAEHASRKITSLRSWGLVTSLVMWCLLAWRGDIPTEFSTSLIMLIVGFYYKRDEGSS